MKSNLLRYKLASTLETAVRICALIIFLAGLALIKTSVLGAAILIVAGIFPFLSHTCIEFDLYGGTYRMGLNYLGLYTTGTKESYPGADYLFLKKNRTIHRSNRHTWSTTYSISFEGYILFADGEKLLIIQSGKKDKALKQLQRIAQDLKTEVKDLTF